MLDPSQRIIEIIEQPLLKRSLNSLEAFILTQSWQGNGYEAMAKEAGYSVDYVKQVGSFLWSELSGAVGKSITKKNLRLTLEPLLDQLMSGPETDDASMASVTQVSVNDPLIIPLDPSAPALSPASSFSASVSPEVLSSQSDRPTPLSEPATFSHFPSGPLPLQSSLYIERPPMEAIAYDELHRVGCLLRIKAPRRMGKSSLLNRLMAHVQQQGYHSITLDCQEASENVLESTDLFLRWFCCYLAQALKVEAPIGDRWIAEMGSKVNCKRYVEKEILARLDRPLVIAINELNRLFEYPTIARDFLPMLRFWHEQSKDHILWQKLRLILVYATDMYTPLHLRKSPFNVGIPIRLLPFNTDQIRTLSGRYGLDWSESQEADFMALHQMIDGHPYLASLAFYYLRQGELSLTQLLATAATPNGIYRNHLEEHLVTLQDAPRLAHAFKGVVDSETGMSLDVITTHKLEGMGLVQIQDGRVHPICDLYRIYFQEQLQVLPIEAD